MRGPHRDCIFGLVVRCKSCEIIPWMFAESTNRCRGMLRTGKARSPGPFQKLSGPMVDVLNRLETAPIGCIIPPLLRECLSQPTGPWSLGRRRTERESNKNVTTCNYIRSKSSKGHHDRSRFKRSLVPSGWTPNPKYCHVPWLPETQAGRLPSRLRHQVAFLGKCTARN